MSLQTLLMVLLISAVGGAAGYALVLWLKRPDRISRSGGLLLVVVAGAIAAVNYFGERSSLTAISASIILVAGSALLIRAKQSQRVEKSPS
jgi:drug/metabolite transporter (DMT)-like permease